MYPFYEQTISIMEGFLQKNRIMSFFSFLSDNYELSPFVLPKKRPENDNLDT